jgi:deoxyribodipyrimidine photolyase-related protein
MISPREVVERVELAWRSDPVKIGLNAAEGYIRQILGWREYMRGMYWGQMPQFKQLNFFSHTAQLPDWYWTGNTKMNCLKHSIGQSLENAYAHHIQRLMVIGNFALLAGIHPDKVDQWYLGIYIDAIEWVEITNTRGMSQFADGGLIGTKPYISGAAYISKMSNYCKTCFYDKTKRTGFRACPFNSLYWNFLDRHVKQLADNHRMQMMYALWNKISNSEKEKILIQANDYLTHINEL